MTVGLIDNDILLKLISFQLMDEAIDSLQLSTDRLFVLSTALYRFKRKRKQQEEYPDDIWASAIAFVESCSSIAKPDLLDLGILSEVQQLNAFPDQIHQGEIDLIIATRTIPDFLLMSGDKNCMKALYQLPDEIYQRLCGRVVCLEQVVLKMIDLLGFKVVCDRIKPAAKCDKTIQLCFGYSEPAPESEVCEALQSYIDEIHRAAPGLLIKLR